MREIKFRAWDKETNNWYHFDAGFLDYSEHQANYPVAFCQLIDSIIPMQFTGLKDKNGKEIYDGDILQHDIKGNGQHRVEWWNGRFMCCDVNLSAYLSAGAAVIGNIYEHPHLLTHEA